MVNQGKRTAKRVGDKSLVRINWSFVLEKLLYRTERWKSDKYLVILA